MSPTNQEALDVPPPERAYAPGRVLKLFSYETGSATLTVLDQFAVGQRVPQVLLCRANESRFGGDGVYKVCFFDPRYVIRQALIPVGLGSSSCSSLVADVVESTRIPFFEKNPEEENTLAQAIWEADQRSRTAPTRGVVSSSSSAHSQVDRKALANLPRETPEIHCRRIFRDYFCAHERFFDTGPPAYGSYNVSCTADAATYQPWKQTLPVLFLGPPISPLQLPSPITGNILRRLTPDRLEMFMAEMLKLAEQATQKKVYISNLGFEHFGYHE
jgi:hypothetical protein